MADAKPQRISIGFDGGQVLSTRVAREELTKLLGALRGPSDSDPSAGTDGWHELTAEDGTVALALKSVVYVLVDHEGHQVGFGG